MATTAKLNRIAPLEGIDARTGVSTEEIIDWLRSTNCPDEVITALEDLTCTPAVEAIDMTIAGRNILARYLYYLWAGDDDLTSNDPKNKLRTVFLETYNKLFKNSQAKKTYEKRIPTEEEFTGHLEGLANATNATQIQAARMLLLGDINALRKAAAHYETNIPESIRNFSFNNTSVFALRGLPTNAVKVILRGNFKGTAENPHAGWGTEYEMQQAKNGVWSGSVSGIVPGKREYKYFVTFGDGSKREFPEQGEGKNYKRTVAEIPATLSNDVAELIEKIETARGTSARMQHIRSDANQPAVPSVVVYSCIERELQLQGISGQYLKQETARAFAEFAVACGRPYFGKAPHEAHGIVEAAKLKAEAAHTLAAAAITEITRHTIDHIFNWPVLYGLKLNASIHDLVGAIGHVPPEQILHLIAYIRHMVEAREHGKFGGARSDQMPGMGAFSGKLEKIAAVRYAEPISKAEKPAVYAIVENTHMAIEEALRDGMADHHKVVHDWKHIEPAKGQHPKEHGGGGFMEILHSIATWTQTVEILKWLTGSTGGKKEEKGGGGHGHGGH